jgi:hypothetical protein
MGIILKPLKIVAKKLNKIASFMTIQVEIALNVDLDIF